MQEKFQIQLLNETYLKKVIKNLQKRKKWVYLI